ncbi:hypothetical protein [Kamptonema sp. UHCC 0994]|nr:hypothetical protein [Kamptonema sp. UHCC 0994]
MPLFRLQATTTIAHPETIAYRLNNSAHTQVCKMLASLRGLYIV